MLALFQSITRYTASSKSICLALLLQVSDRNTQNKIEILPSELIARLTGDIEQKPSLQLSLITQNQLQLHHETGCIAHHGKCR